MHVKFRLINVKAKGQMRDPGIVYKNIAKQTLEKLGVRLAMLSGSPVTTVLRVLRLQMEETASRYGG
jgi:hypothetical protein